LKPNDSGNHVNEASTNAVELLMRPRSIAVIGVSSRPRTAGRTVLANIDLNEFAGQVHVVGRGGGEVEGHALLEEIDDLPQGVDLAVLTLPAPAVKEALEACARRKVGAVTVFASGFAEAGERAAQDELVAIARNAGMALLGPNCLGYTNLVDGLPIGFAHIRRVARLAEAPGKPAVAMVSQSGGLLAFTSIALSARGLPMSYTVSTGNEAGIGIADFVDFFADDAATHVIALYLEEVRDPPAFLAAAARARAAGKPLVMIHPGRGAKGRAAVQSHTGALAGDYDTMRVTLERAGIVLVDTMEAFVDVVEILAQYPRPPVAGPGILTFSGGFCAIAHDYFEDMGLEIPALTAATADALRLQLPAFIPPSNPLDLGTQAMWQPELTGIGAGALAGDDAVGSLIVAINSGTPQSLKAYGPHFIAALKGRDKPAILAFSTPNLDPEFVTSVRDSGLVLSQSIEGSMRAIATLTHFGRAMQRAAPAAAPKKFDGLPPLGAGTQPEWLGKRLLAALGIAVPEGGLARDADEAEAIAARVGYPVALKAQAGALSHKTEAGGVALNIPDALALRAAWDTVVANVARDTPGLALDGLLVERMAPKGLELMIGARRDPKWGPVLLVGLGGIWVEALGDVRIMAPDLAEADIVAELHRLRSAKLLQGFRGQPAVDVAAVARTAALIGPADADRAAHLGNRSQPRVRPSGGRGADGSRRADRDHGLTRRTMLLAAH
jgi:acyl-CoA synthetase (NDP forming)